MGEDKGILQAGGIGGLAAGVIIVSFTGIVLALGGALTAEETLQINQDQRTFYVLLQIGNIAWSLLPVPLFLALHRILRTVGPARALLGATFGVAGGLVFAANWSITATAYPVFSDLWAAAPAAEKQIFVVAAEIVEQITHSFQSLAALLIGLAFASFGWALLARPDIPNGYGWASSVLGLIGAASALSGLVGFAVAGFGVLALFALFLLMGWKVYSLSKTA